MECVQFNDECDRAVNVPDEGAIALELTIEVKISTKKTRKKNINIVDLCDREEIGGRLLILKKKYDPCQDIGKYWLNTG